VASKNNGSDFKAMRTMVFGGFKRVTKKIWKKLVRNTYAKEDEMIADRNIPTFTTEEMEEMEEMMMNIYEDDGEFRGGGDRRAKTS
jgi:hypothetical protein